jgi:hypothetical protein
MKIYLAGPMRGIKDFNFPAFYAAAAKLRAEGHKVFSPAERDVKKYGEKALKTRTGSEEEVAKRLKLTGNQLARTVFEIDTRWICRHAEAIALLPGWRASRGARAEKALGEALGIRIIYERGIT